MDLLIGFAFLAGIITVLSPCVLPVLPVILSGTVAGGRLRPLGIISGFLVSFTVLTLSLTFLVRAFGIDPDLLRWIAAATIILFGLVLVIPALKDRFMSLATRLLVRRQAVGPVGLAKPAGKPTSGYWTGLLTGLSLGVVWTPCVGPIMASVITLAISQSIDSSAVLITLAYAMGTALPLFAVMQGGRAVFARFPRLTSRLPVIQRVFGVLMLVTGLALLTGWDRNFSTWLLTAFPGYGSGLTAIEDNPAVKAALDKRASSGDNDPKAAIPDRSGTDPLARTSGQWFNSPPLTLEGLQGKVVLVDFWTYSCINCLRTMPYLKAWQARYAKEGLVIVGVHSPEFAFEHDAGNVEAAIKSIGVTWPVVQDNAFGIWNAFANRYWPAHYLFDRSGKLVDTHFGEGAYDETERMIQTLLGQTPGQLSAVQADAAAGDINPETYLGSARGQVLEPVDPGDGSLYQLVQPLGQFGWGLEGNWLRQEEFVEAAGLGSLSLDFQAKSVYVVISTVDGASAELSVTANGQPVQTPDVRDGHLVPGASRLYQVFAASTVTKGVLTITVKGRARLHAFTFS